MKDIYDTCLDESITRNADNNFSIDLGNYEVYDQQGSATCWIFASMNLIKKELARKLNYNEGDLDLSVSYIYFCDRYEKLDKLYDRIINGVHELSNIKYLLFDYINSFGSFAAFRYLVSKYGIVSERQMPASPNLFVPNDVNMIMKEKVLGDIDIILESKKSKTTAELNKLKEKFLQEDYDILSDIFGEPPEADSILSKATRGILEQYMNVVSLNSLKPNKEYDLSFNVPNFAPTKYLNVKIPKIKNAIIGSLKSGDPVWFGCSCRYMSGSVKNKAGILDSHLYNFEKIGVKKLPKQLAEKYNFLNYDHAMVFTGVDLKNNNANKWKALNTFGKDNNRDGYFIMNNNFFNENVFIFAIKKKYLR